MQLTIKAVAPDPAWNKIQHTISYQIMLKKKILNNEYYMKYVITIINGSNNQLNPIITGQLHSPWILCSTNQEQLDVPSYLPKLLLAQNTSISCSSHFE